MMHRAIMIRLQIRTNPKMADIYVPAISATTGPKALRNESMIGLIVNIIAKRIDAQRRGTDVHIIELMLNLLDLMSKKINTKVKAASKIAMYGDTKTFAVDTSSPARTSFDKAPSSTS